MQNEPVSKLQLSVSAKNLKDVDILSKSDPQVHAYIWSHDTHSWAFLGKTEVVWNNLNPEFSKSFIVDYRFEESQLLRFVLVDIDDENINKRTEDLDFLGLVEVTLAKIFTSHNQTIVLPLKDRNNTYTTQGLFKIIAEEIPTNNKFDVHFQFSARNLEPHGIFGRLNPFYVISRSREDRSWVKVHTSEVIKNNQNPLWLPFTTKLSTLVGGDRDRTLLIEIFGYEKSGSHMLIGSLKGSINDFERQIEQPIPIVNPKVSKPGEFVIKRVKFTENKSFLDYISEGLDVNLIVAIDFTSSNGDPASSSSLHYRSNLPNSYQLAIKAVGDILLEYDSDKKVPVFGFGAKFKDGSVSHCFPLNGLKDNPEVYGVEGILDVYNFAMNNITLWGPTNFSPILRTTESIIKNSMSLGLKNYFILLIITDGVITDMESTIQSIVDLSCLPLSVVIVGVGNADFANMNILDGDDEMLNYNGRVAERDIVQFVPFSRIHTPHILARETLEEIPEQVTSYMKKLSIPVEDREWMFV